MANSRKLQEAADRDMAMNFAFNGKRLDLASAQRMEADLHAKREDRIATQQMEAVVGAKAPRLSETWKPVADRLNADAARLADLETTPGLADTPVLVTLQVQARTRLLDRVRRALWLCTVILCQQKGEPQPAPLGELAVASAEPRP
jgi:hypothetical protein